MLNLTKAGVVALLLASISLGMTYVLWTAEASQIRGDAVLRHHPSPDSGLGRRHLLSAEDAAVPGRTAVVVFQQDEADLIYDWMFYYSRIFGLSRLYIIDHNSTLPSVTHLLSYAEAVGVNVVRFDGPFIHKHQMLTDTIHNIFKTCPGVDTVIPLDTDEFIIAQDPEAANEDTYTTSPSVIRSHIDALPRDGFKYKFGSLQAAACNVDERSLAEPRQRRPLTAMYFSPCTKTGSRHKTFFHRNGFVQTDQGNHIGKVENDELCPDYFLRQQDAESQGPHVSDTLTFTDDGSECFHATPLAVVHFGGFALSFAMWQRKMYRGAHAYGFTENTECEGIGVHYCKAIQAMNEDLEGTRLKREAIHCWHEIRYYSTFMVDALFGQIGRLDYTVAPKLEKSD